MCLSVCVRQSFGPPGAKVLLLSERVFSGSISMGERGCVGMSASGVTPEQRPTSGLSRDRPSHALYLFVFLQHLFFCLSS